MEWRGERVGVWCRAPMSMRCAEGMEGVAPERQIAEQLRLRRYHGAGETGPECAGGALPGIIEESGAGEREDKAGPQLRKR